MSDLTAANCGCNDSCNGVSNANYNNGGCGCGGNGSSWIWILILLFFLNGNGFGRSGNNGCGCGTNGIGLFNNGGSCCDWLICILLLSSVCGGNGCNN